MDKRFIWTATAILVVTICSAMIANLPERPSTTPLQETVSGVERATDIPENTVSEADSSQPDYAYIMREYEGRIAIFSADNDTEPEMVLDTMVKFLPDTDQGQMREGIKVRDYKELVSLIEDYVS